MWKHERRGGKWTKVPYRAVDGGARRPQVDDPRTWGTFEQAIARAAEVQGIGYVFSAEDPFGGVDLDACIDRQTGELHPAAAEILDSARRLPGALAVGRRACTRSSTAKLNGDRNRTGDTPWGDEFEVYDRGRFFTVTGDGRGAIVERQAQLDAVVARMFGQPSQNGAGPATAATRTAWRRRAGDPRSARGSRQDRRSQGHQAEGRHARATGTTCSRARAAEHGYDDGMLVALIRHARAEARRGQGRAAPTTSSARSRPSAGRSATSAPTPDHDQILAELTKAIRLDGWAGERGRRRSLRGHGNTAAATILLDDGYAIEFPSFEHVAQPGKLADQLVHHGRDHHRLLEAPVPPGRVAGAPVAASRREELRDHAVYVDDAIRLLELAQTIEFDLDNQPEKWEAWALVDATDPEEIPQGRRVRDRRPAA